MDASLISIDSARHRTLRVALVSMPFSVSDRPSIQIALLSTIARRAGHESTTHHLNLELASEIPDVYDVLCGYRGQMTGEWLFSLAAFGQDVHQDDNEYFTRFPREVTRLESLGCSKDKLSQLRHVTIPRYLTKCLESEDWGTYDVIGFSSTFQQTVASLALAHKIKERWPGIRILLGGANAEDEMGLELLRAFTCLDDVIIGEGDLAFTQYLKRIAERMEPSGILGVATRQVRQVNYVGQAVPVEDLNDLPVPDYSEYFERARRLKINAGKGSVVALPFESSRGCWWGKKKHCTFCGLNGTGMAFRSKQPARVLEELDQLAVKYSISMFQATDNILDQGYISKVFGVIEQEKRDYQFFYEVKSNLSHDQIRTLYKGGVRWVQPGIESLSSRILRLMDKGCTMLHNVRFLKWCRYYKIRVGWNLLWGFPGEQVQDYKEELEVMKLIGHLEPPNASGRILMERFAPIYFDRSRFPADCIVPEASYSYAFPRHVDLEKIAYVFDYSLNNTLAEGAHQDTFDYVQDWKRRWMDERPTMYYRRTKEAIFIDDNREPKRTGTHVFYGPLSMAYEYCSETMRSAQEVQGHLASMSQGKFPGEEVDAALLQFCDRGLMVSEGGRYLSLAIPMNPNW
jgi:ribosomal peptide maturation radical SAM protein 1